MGKCWLLAGFLHTGVLSSNKKNNSVDNLQDVGPTLGMFCSALRKPVTL